MFSTQRTTSSIRRAGDRPGSAAGAEPGLLVLKCARIVKTDGPKHGMTTPGPRTWASTPC
jgi:hypothetical protein